MRISSRRSQTARGWRTPSFSTGMPRSCAMRMPMPAPPLARPELVQHVIASTGVAVAGPSRIALFRASSLRAAGEQLCLAGCRAEAIERQRCGCYAESVRQSRSAFPLYPGQNRNRVRRLRWIWAVIVKVHERLKQIQCRDGEKAELYVSTVCIEMITRHMKHGFT